MLLHRCLHPSSSPAYANASARLNLPPTYEQAIMSGETLQPAYTPNFYRVSEVCEGRINEISLFPLYNYCINQGIN